MICKLDSAGRVYPLFYQDELRNMIPIASLVHLRHLKILADDVRQPRAVLLLGKPCPGSWDASHFPSRCQRVVAHASDSEALNGLLDSLSSRKTYLFKLHDPEIQKQVRRTFDLEPAIRLLYLTVTAETFLPAKHQDVETLSPESPDVLDALAKSGRTGEELSRHFYTRAFGIWMDSKLAACAFVMAKTKHVCEISGVYTEPEFRGYGLGKAVVSAATQHVLEKGWIPCYGTREANLPSLRLAKGLGFWYYQEVDYCTGRKRHNKG